MTQEWYAIEVREAIPDEWSGWFGGLAVQPTPTGGCRLSGPLPDQAALHGVLARIRDLNLTLVALAQGTAALPEGNPDACDPS